MRCESTKTDVLTSGSSATDERRKNVKILKMAILQTEHSETLHPEGHGNSAAQARTPHSKGGGDPEADAGKYDLIETGSDVWHECTVRYVLAESLSMASFVVTSATTAAIMTGWVENHSRRVTIKCLVVSMPRGAFLNEDCN